MNWLFRCTSFIEQFELELDTRLREAIERKLHEISKRKVLLRTKTFEQYDGNVWVLKLTAPQNIRVVMEHQNIGGHTILFVREYISPGKYEPLWRKTMLPRIQEGIWPKQFPLTQDEIDKALNEINSHIIEISKKPMRPTLTPELKDWLVDFKASCSEFCIYESVHWLKFIESEFKDEWAQNVARAIRAVISSSSEVIETTITENIHLAKYKEDGIQIALIFEDTGLRDQKGDIRKILLHNCTINSSESKIQAMAKEQNALLNYDSSDYHLASDEVLKQVSSVAYKAYPDFALKDPAVWLSIERNKSTSNLALSPEQIGLLSKIDFPKFINGQAGSGKSTMLYYLFAEMCFRKLFDEIKGELVFLTENPELLKSSRHEVREILRLNPHYSTMLAEEDLLLDKVTDCFHSFDDFVYYKLLSDDERELFPIDKMIKFPQFKNAYLNSELADSIKRRYSPEISWFIITTFIKGYHWGGYVIPEKEQNSLSFSVLFTSLSRGDSLGIDNETFKGVYHNVWKFYKRLQEKGYWDRLDIVRHISKTYGDAIDRKWVVFCDEAQDFTRIELQLLIRVSEYARHDLSSQKLVPIVFAGDPFQTVNPTGFSLANLKKLFRHELCEQLNYSENSQRDIVEDLRLNYRSTPEIVNMANIIQFIRYKYLNNDDLAEPQSAKHRSSNSHPKLFFFSQNSELFDKLRYDIILIPSDDDKKEQLDFWSSSGWNSNEANLKCAVSAKGAEYDRIILYRFGDEFCRQFGNSFLSQIFSNPSFFDQQTDSKKFSIGFFFNKLYVSITRAKSEIIVIESADSGSKSFWEVILKDSNLQKAIDKSDRWSSVNKENFLDIASSSTMIIASDVNTALKNAEEEFSKALLYRDPDRMRTAANLYKQSNSPQKSKLALAYSMRFEKKWQEASRLFKELDYSKEYMEMLWISGDWRNILSFTEQFSSRDKELSVKMLVARLMMNKDISFNFLTQDLLSNINAIKQEANYPDIKWFDSFELQIIRAFTLIDINLIGMSNPTIFLADALIKYHIQSKPALSSAAEYLYSISSYNHAVTIWNSIEHIDHEKFYIASLQIMHTDPSTPIFYLHKLGKYDEIKSLYSSLGNAIKKEYLKLVADSYIKTDAFEGALASADIDMAKAVYDTVGFDSRRTRVALQALDTCMKKGECNCANIVDNPFLNKLLQLFNKNAKWKKLSISSFDNRESRRQSESIFTNAYNSDSDLRKCAEFILSIISRTSLVPENLIIEDPSYRFYDNLPVLYIEHIFAVGKSSLHFNIYELSSSLERMCGRFVDILRIYDEILLKMSSLSNEEKKWLFTRWLKVKVKSIRRNDRDIKPEIILSRIDEEVRKKLPPYRKDVPSLEIIETFDAYPSFDKHINTLPFIITSVTETENKQVFIEPEKVIPNLTILDSNQPTDIANNFQQPFIDAPQNSSEDVLSNSVLNMAPPKDLEMLQRENSILKERIDSLQNIIVSKDDLLKAKDAQIESKNSELQLAKEMIALLRQK
jgi:hypothetical protein